MHDLLRQHGIELVTETPEQAWDPVTSLRYDDPDVPDGPVWDDAWAKEHPGDVVWNKAIRRLFETALMLGYNVGKQDLARFKT